MLWLAVHFPQLSLDLFQAELAASHSAAEQAEAACAAVPAVILQDNKVCLRNAAAQTQGIELGCTLATAHSIVSQLQFRHRDCALEQKQLRNLAQTLYRFSGHVNVLSDDCIVLEIGGSLKLFGDHTSLASAAAAVCQELGYTISTHVAGTPRAALAIARHKACQPTSNGQLANVPLSLAGFELSDCQNDLIERFANMGIHTLGPVLRLPSKELGRRFGPQLLTYVARLTGQLPDPLEPIAPVANFHHTLHLLKPVRDKTHLFAHPSSPMPKLLKELQQWLISHQFGCEQMVWTFASGNTNLQQDDRQETTHIPVKFAQARQNPDDMLRFSELKLEQVSLPSEVISIGLRTYRLSAWNNQSQPLFALHSQTGQAADQLGNHQKNELVDELNARFGEGSCLCIHQLDQHAPEYAWATDLAAQRDRQPTAAQPLTQQLTQQPTQQLTKKRPLWLFDPPRPIAISELQLLQGPERLQTHWWQSQSHNTAITCRDYYIARHQQSGAECWAFVDPSTQWYLHGYFG